MRIDCVSHAHSRKAIFPHPVYFLSLRAWYITYVCWKQNAVNILSKYVTFKEQKFGLENSSGYRSRIFSHFYISCYFHHSIHRNNKDIAWTTIIQILGKGPWIIISQILAYTEHANETCRKWSISRFLSESSDQLRQDPGVYLWLVPGESKPSGPGIPPKKHWDWHISF